MKQFWRVDEEERQEERPGEVTVVEGVNVWRELRQQPSKPVTWAGRALFQLL